MRILRNPNPLPATPFIEVKVDLGNDKKTVCAQVLFSRWTSERTVEFTKPGFGVPVVTAWERALAEAERIGAELIVVIDPDNLFPAAA